MCYYSHAEETCAFTTHRRVEEESAHTARSEQALQSNFQPGAPWPWLKTKVLCQSAPNPSDEIVLLAPSFVSYMWSRNHMVGNTSMLGSSHGKPSWTSSKKPPSPTQRAARWRVRHDFRIPGSFYQWSGLAQAGSEIKTDKLHWFCRRLDGWYF